MRTRTLSFLTCLSILSVSLPHVAWADSYTQAQLFDRILAEDQVLAELAPHVESDSAGSGLLRSIRNPQIRASYGEDEDEKLDEGATLDEDREAYEIDLRFFIPNPYEITAASAEAESAQYRIKATAQQYFSTKITRARELWADLRYATHMMDELKSVAPFWTETFDLIKGVGQESPDLAPDLLSWQLDYFRFLELKSEVNSMYWNSLEELARFANVDVSSMKLEFADVDAGFGQEPAEDGFESPQLLDQKMRVAREESRLAEIQAENIPWVDHIQGSYGELNSDFDRESWSVQVAVSLPIFSVFSGEKNEQAALLQAEQATLKLLEDGEVQSMIQLRQSMEARKSMLSLYQDQVLPQLEMMKGLLPQGGAGQTGPIGDQIDLADSFLKTVQNYHQIHREVEQLIIEMDALQGRIP